MKGYIIGCGYMGYLPSVGRYLLFCTEDEYKEEYEYETRGTDDTASETGKIPQDC